MSDAGVIELYWIPGCTSCLRMKEFVESSGVPFESVNVDEDPTRARRLQALGGSAPAAVRGGSWVDGGDLRSVAELIGVPHHPHAPLPPEELHLRYQVVMATLLGLLHDTPPTVLDAQPQGWEWTMRDIAHHAGCVMRVFLMDYDPDGYRGPTYVMDYERNRAPKGTESIDDLSANAIETLKYFNRWWQQDGFDDPLERIVPTYWGHQTLHAAFEREVWHTAQHTRQIETMLLSAGVRVTSGLTARMLEGLPMPERVFL
jgi:glutaredoxin